MEINCDVAELSREVDDAILPWVDACNVCCGAHAGDEALIRGTIREAVRLDVSVGAHPSWPDRENFGRRTMELSLDQLRLTLREQIAFVKSVVEEAGGRLRHVKPHGALYHDVIANAEFANCLVETVYSIDPDLAIYGMSDSSVKEVCDGLGISFVHEAFADRRYESRTKLRSRSEADALIDDEASFRDHVGQLLMGMVTDVSGQAHHINVDTACIHSDTPNATTLARIAREMVGA